MSLGHSHRESNVIRLRPARGFEWEEMKMMFAQESDDENISCQTEACYEERAWREEIYLEETVEELRMVLESDDPSSPQNDSSIKQREQAVEELIIGDSDDPPLSEETVEDMLRITSIVRISDEHDL